MKTLLAFFFAVGIITLSVTALIDCIGDSEKANKKHSFWKRFYGIENKLFDTASFVTIVSAAAYILVIVLEFIVGLF